MMTKGRRLLMSVAALLTLLLVGIALTIVGPLPEERAFNKLSQTKVKFYWSGNSAREAFAKLNEELGRGSNSRYRFTIAEGANDASSIAMELDDAPATEVGFYLAVLSGNQMYKSSSGVVIDGMNRESFYHKPSWRRRLRGWVEYRLPGKLQLWLQQWRAPPPPQVSLSGDGPSDSSFGPPTQQMIQMLQR